MRNLHLVFLLIITTYSFHSLTQQNFGHISGNFQVDVQYYNQDSLIGAPNVPEKMLMNGFGNINYVNQNFSAGIRYESYLNALQGFDPNYKGTGIPYRFARYQNENIDITAGSFYEQFGSGMILRSYEERNLGYDNAFDGFRVKYNIDNSIYIKGIYGKQRLFFSQGEGIVRGIDGEVLVNQLFDSLNWKTNINIGGSFVSKYQADEDVTLVLPENVSAFGGRLNLIRGNFGLSTEYTYKINDPSAQNNYIYKPGQGMLINASYSQKGLGILLNAKTIDNMSFRSDRNAAVNNLFINYLPATTKQHSYNLPATLYPYAVQPNGEVAFMGDIAYKIKKNTFLGGKYGTKVSVNFSTAYSLDSTAIQDSSRMGYKTNFFVPGEEHYFQDFNVEIRKKLSSKVKFAYTYFNILYNMDVIQGLQGKGTVRSSIHVLDLTYKINSKHSIRFEGQHLGVSKKQKYYEDQGNWVTGLVEYTISPKWFFAVLDQYNYGNSHAEKRIHYVYTTAGYIHHSTRISLSAGRQRAGIFCVGGVCRNVPASNGVALSITSSF